MIDKYVSYLNMPDEEKIDLSELYNYLKSIVGKNSSKITRTKYDEIYIFRGDSFKSTCVIRSIKNKIYVFHRSKNTIYDMKHFNRRFNNIDEAILNNWLDYFWEN